MFWGYSPAIDFLSLGIGRNMEEVNILLVGQADGRHLLKTLARSYRYNAKKLNFYIVENMLEQIAREILMCTIIFDPLEDVGLFNKSTMFMEMYGNLLVRPATSNYIANKAHHLIKMISDVNVMDQCMPMLDVSMLKYKHRDYLETVFKFWERCGNDDFDACSYWNSRVRRLLGTRYDTRVGAFDWDYYMRVKSDAEIDRICMQEYKHFRETGVAFTRMDCEYTDANMSLAAGVVEDGTDLFHNGYLGDVVTGPFIAYGLDCEDKDMLKITNKSNNKRATDITERNLTRYFYEIENKHPYVHEEVLDESRYNLGAMTLVLPEVRLGRTTTHKRNFTPWKPIIPSENIKIHFLNPTGLKEYTRMNKINDYFHCMFIGQHMLKNITSDSMKLLKRGAEIFIETRANAFMYTKEEMTNFGAEITEFAEANGFIACKEFDPVKETISNFVKYS